jgi:hypothetical protein
MKERLTLVEQGRDAKNEYKLFSLVNSSSRSLWKRWAILLDNMSPTLGNRA